MTQKLSTVKALNAEEGRLGGISLYGEMPPRATYRANILHR